MRAHSSSTSALPITRAACSPAAAGQAPQRSFVSAGGKAQVAPLPQHNSSRLASPLAAVSGSSNNNSNNNAREQ
jgi:hypothetical protein